MLYKERRVLFLHPSWFHPPAWTQTTRGLSGSSWPAPGVLTFHAEVFIISIFFLAMAFGWCRCKKCHVKPAFSSKILPSRSPDTHKDCVEFTYLLGKGGRWERALDKRNKNDNLKIDKCKLQDRNCACLLKRPFWSSCLLLETHGKNYYRIKEL